MSVRRTGVLLLVMSLAAGCAGMLSWEDGRGRRDTGLQGKAPPPVEKPPKKKAGAAKPLPTKPEDFPPAEPLPPAGEGEYRVQRGDTLYSIAFRHNLDFRELARWNGIGADYRISVHQLLRLAPPPRGTVVVAQPPPAPASGPRAVKIPPPMPALPLGFEWTWPTRGAVVRGYAPAQGSKGIDIGGELGQPIFAAAPGRVVYSGNALKGYGELIIIKHDELHLSAYGYNRKRHVVEGDVVTSGQPIGELGMGPESKPLLHFELRAKGKPVDPSKYLPKPS